MNAVFDRGYYRIISFKDMEGKIIVERVRDITFEGVPQWFIDLVTIKAPSADALVMTGWTQAGVLHVESHSGYAYRTMWDGAVKMSLYFLIAGAIAHLIGGLGLHILLKPLKRVELQAGAICRKNFQIQEKIPKTKELRQVVESMNRMTLQVREMFTGQVKIAERLRRNVYSDQLTGLGNRRYMTGQVGAHLEAATGSMYGALLLLQLDNLQKVNEIDGVQCGDALLKKVADIIKQETRMFNDVALARLTGGDFAIFISEINIADASEVAGNLSQKMNHLSASNPRYLDNFAYIGGVAYENAPSHSRLLAEADNVLQVARQQGPDKWLVNSLSPDKSTVVKDKMWWRKTFDDVLNRKEVILFSQPVLSSTDCNLVLHQEFLSRIAVDTGEIVSAGVFFPLAERLELVSKLDRVILEKVFAQQTMLTSLQRIAVNVSSSSLSDREFSNWIVTELTRFTDKSIHIIFEFPECGAVQYIDEMKDFSRKVQQLGHGVGLDHFGQSFSSFDYLKSLRPEYVKIDRAFINEIEHDHGDSEFFIAALCGVAHSLDIRVIVEGVERDEQVGILLDLDVDGLQGYLFGRPKKI